MSTRCSLAVTGIIVFLILWMIFFHPNEPHVTVMNASLNQFNLTAATNVLAYNLAINLTLRNPNKRAVIQYRSIQVTGMYSGKKFASVTLSSTPFYQGHKNTTVLPQVLLQGQQFVKFKRRDVSNFNEENAAGIYPHIDVKIAFRVRYKYANVFSISEYNPTICCMLEDVPMSSLNGASASSFTAKCKNFKRVARRLERYRC